ncbi:MAG TPA: hypothetical protein VGN39_10670, partial [Terriglobales bacterium]|nr:hypothetical protein [Terriglobales bacterium]
MNPATGSVSLDIKPPVPPARGITLPFSFSYNSGQLASLADYLGTVQWHWQSGDVGTSTGWQNTGMPYATWQLWQVKYLEYGSAYFSCFFASGFTFVDSSGVSHNLNLGVQVSDPNYPNSCGATTVSAGGDGQAQGVFGANAETQ